VTLAGKAKYNIEETIRGYYMSENHLGWIANFIWGIADDVLRDTYVRGKSIFMAGVNMAAIRAHIDGSH